MMRSAMSDYAIYDLFAAGDEIDHRAEVFMGEASTVGLRVDSDVAVALHRRARRDMRVSVKYEGPLSAPSAAGDVVATLRVEAPDYEPVEYPLLATEDVPQKGMMGRIGAALAHLIRG